MPRGVGAYYCFARMQRQEPNTTLTVQGTRITTSETQERYREKIARITLDSMVQFVGLLDAKGTVLEINKVALDAVGVSLAEVEGPRHRGSALGSLERHSSLAAGHHFGHGRGRILSRDLLLRGRDAAARQTPAAVGGRGGGDPEVSSRAVTRTIAILGMTSVKR